MSNKEHIDSISSDTKLSSLSIVDGLIVHHHRRGTISESYFRWSKEELLPNYLYNKEVVSLLNLIKVDRREFKIEGSGVMYALYFLRSLFEVFGDLMPKFFNLPLEDQLQPFHIMCYWNPVQAIDNEKFFTCYPFAKYIHQEEMPSMPSCYTDLEGNLLNPLIWVGKVRRMLKNRIVAYNRKNTRLWGSLLLGVKRATYVVDKDFIQRGYEKHKNVLSRPPEQSEHSLLEYAPYITRALKRARPIRKYKLYDASTSASFEYKASDGGQREYVRDWLMDFSYSAQLSSKYLSSMYLGKDYHIHEIRTMDTDYAIDNACRQYHNSGPLKVMVHGLTEPLKVRLITKGEAIPYWISKDFQKYMWNYLQEFEQFSPTGKPLSVEDLDLLNIRKHKIENKYGVKFDKWVSGDYSAATDGVNLHMTMMIFYQFAKKANISDDLTELLSKVIGPQEIHYPLKDEEGRPLIEPFVQQNGQLMGSTLSFPILCIINLIAYWKAMEDYTGQSIPMSDLPVLVNGDDILFPANDFFYELFWKNSIDGVGFKLSLGKNYISDRILTINSMVFDYHNDKFTQIPFFNSGLITGVSKHGGRTNEKIKPIWDIYNQAIAGCYDQARAHRRFIHYYKDTINSITGHGLFNLFANWEAGGLGFRNPFLSKITLDKEYWSSMPRSFRRKYASQKIRITTTQRHWAQYCRDSTAYSLMRNGRIAKLGLIEYNTNSYKYVQPLAGQRNYLKVPNNLKDSLPAGLFAPIKEDTPDLPVAALAYSYDFIKQPLFKIKHWKEIAYDLNIMKLSTVSTSTESKYNIDNLGQTSFISYIISRKHAAQRPSNQSILSDPDYEWYISLNNLDTNMYIQDCNGVPMFTNQNGVNH